MNKILICVAVYDTDQNNRTAYTIETYNSLISTVNFKTTKIVFIDNASCAKTKKFLSSVKSENVFLITNKTNVGTAEAINLGMKKYADKDTYCVKCDNDVTFGQYGWADKMVECFERDESLGVLGLKRPDLPNSPWHETYTTTLKMLPQERGQSWLVVEECGDLLGTCLMMSPKLREKIGYLYQPDCYGFDDVLLCERSIIAGYYNAFYPHIDIVHVDDGKSAYTQWKLKMADAYLKKIDSLIKDMQNGKNPMMHHDNPIYYNPFE